ncbi:hypothetical protein M407DRAFT_177388 [Tulasnella calospora MUT 4182]|uniref:Uncharacterized protein n=1 Tax=Tulasnella calospora MUT 4182 TaxID=1051891 RepID=A0A0C3QLP8_9AGAM|nr:hypothetical protein M407DRAFT_177388 [Tulasnella calospora MUT 4182]
MPGRTDTGEKFEIRRSETRVYFHSMAAVAKLQILDPQGIPKGQDPVLEGDSFTSWNVTDGNILQAIQEYASIYRKTNPYAFRSRVSSLFSESYQAVC